MIDKRKVGDFKVISQMKRNREYNQNNYIFIAYRTLCTYITVDIIFTGITLFAIFNIG